MRFAPGTTIHRIADLSTVWVVPMSANRISNGSRSASRRWSISTPFPSFRRQISYLYPTLNTATRTTPVRLELPNKDAFASACSPTSNWRPPAIPAGSPPCPSRRSSTPANVRSSCVAGEGKFQPQPVKIGMRGQDSVGFSYGWCRCRSRGRREFPDRCRKQPQGSTVFLQTKQQP